VVQNTDLEVCIHALFIVHSLSLSLQLKIGKTCQASCGLA